jgi:hypothetical protein
MTIAIRSLTVPREHRLISQGQTVVILATIANVGLSSVLLNPSYVPLISIFDPDNAVLVNEQPMTFLDTGVYLYNFETTQAHEIGVYTATVTTINLNLLNEPESARLDKVVVFKIIKSSDFTAFTYFAIKDQDNVVWYWYVAADNTLASSATVPSSVGKLAVPVVLSVVPSWLQITDPSATIMYVYPSLAGEPSVTATQPVVGSGNVGSPTLIGISGGSFVIALNIVDEIILNTV